MDELQFLAAQGDLICRGLEKLFVQENRDESWACKVDKTSRAVNMKILFGLSYSEEFVNTNVLPILRRAQVEMIRHQGEGAKHYQHNLDFRIAVCQTYVSGELVLPEDATPEEIRDLERWNRLFKNHREYKQRVREFYGK